MISKEQNSNAVAFKDYRRQMPFFPPSRPQSRAEFQARTVSLSLRPLRTLLWNMRVIYMNFGQIVEAVRGV